MGRILESQLYALSTNIAGLAIQERSLTSVESYTHNNEMTKLFYRDNQVLPLTT